MTTHTSPRPTAVTHDAGTHDAGTHDAGAETAVRQLSPRAIIGVWAAATAPMALASWVVAPRVARHLGPNGLPKALLVSLTIGLAWQCVLVALLTYREQRTLRWAALRDALWLRPPRSPKTGRRGGRLWWIVVPLVAAVGAEELIPVVAHPASRDFGAFASSPAGEAFFRGAWAWFALAVAMFVLNTVVGEELLFRGYLLPRMQGVFGRRAWLANGALFAAYHVHVPWVIPAVLAVDTLAIALPSQRYRSALVGIAVHSAQSVFFTVALLELVVR
jgi:uncharacterized protein